MAKKEKKKLKKRSGNTAEISALYLIVILKKIAPKNSCTAAKTFSLFYHCRLNSQDKEHEIWGIGSMVKTVKVPKRSFTSCRQRTGSEQKQWGALRKHLCPSAHAGSSPALAWSQLWQVGITGFISCQQAVLSAKCEPERRKSRWENWQCRNARRAVKIREVHPIERSPLKVSRETTRLFQPRWTRKTSLGCNSQSWLPVFTL